MQTRISALGTGFKTAGELVRALWGGPFWWLVPAVALQDAFETTAARLQARGVPFAVLLYPYLVISCTVTVPT